MRGTVTSSTNLVKNPTQVICDGQLVSLPSKVLSERLQSFMLASMQLVEHEIQPPLSVGKLAMQQQRDPS